jgi:glyoxylase-like metal-dependent hydrolase (beta-lactamase superfamily II)
MPDRLIGTTVCPIPVPTPFPVGPITCYLVRGDRPLLVDAGPNTPEAWEALTAGLARWDTPLTALSAIVITHGHPDHLGQAARLAAASGARLWGPEGDRAFIEDYPAELLRWVAFMRGFMPRTGFPGDALERLCRMIEERGDVAEPLRLDRILRDGDRVAGGGLEFTVVHTPGHTPGLVCLHAAAHGLLLSSDHILPTITPNPILQPFEDFWGDRFRGLVAFLASLDRVERLNVSLALPSHGEPVRDLPGRFLAMRAHSADRSQKIHALLDGGQLPLFQVTMGLFPDLPEAQHLLAVFDTIGHADLLVEDGRAAYVERDGLICLARA